MTTMNSKKYNLSDIGVFDGRNFAFTDPKLQDQFDIKALVLECNDTPNEYGYYLPLLYLGGMLVRKGVKRKVEPGEVLAVKFSRYEKNDRLSVR